MSLVEVELGEFAVSRGGSVDPRKRPDETFELYSIPAFDDGKPEIIRGAEIGSSKKIVQPGDVLLSRIVPHIRRSWVVDEYTGKNQIASGEWIIFRTADVDGGYLKRFLTSNVFHPQFMATVSGVGGSLLRARPEYVYKIRIPLPPMEEQKRIAAILDKADAIRRKRQQAIELNDQLLRSVFLDMFGDPIVNRRGYSTTSLGSITRKITDGEHQNPAFVTNGIPMIMAKQVTDSGVDFSGIKFVSADDYTKFARKCKPELEDILIVSRGATIGRTTMVDTDRPFALMGSVILIKVDPAKVEPVWLRALLTHPGYHQKLYKTSSASAQQAIYLSHLREMELPLPVMSDQAKFVRFYRSWKLGLSRQRDSIELSENLVSSLTQSSFRDADTGRQVASS